nr:ribosomal protein S5 [Haemoproteus columbae]
MYVLYNNIDYLYILYFLVILIKSFLLILLKNNNKIKYNFYFYNIYVYIIIIIINLCYFLNEINIFNNYNNKIILNYNYIYFYIYNYYKYNNIKNNKLINFTNIIERIIKITKNSYTIKKGRIKRYKVIMLIGNKCGWIGIGVGKNKSINKALINSRINALNNIYYFKYSLLNIYKLKYVLLNNNKIYIKLKVYIYNYLNIKFLLIKYLLECLGFFNCKIIILHFINTNKLNLLKNLLLILFNLFN